MKHAGMLLATTILLLFCLFNYAYGQSTQYTVKLNSFTLQVTYPSEVMPGDSVTVNVQGSPVGNGVYIQSLTATICYADSSGLHQVATENLVSNSPNAYNYVSYANSGSFSSNFTVNVPGNAPRTSLVAIFSETVRPAYYSYYGWAYKAYPYYPYYYPYYYSNPYTYQAYPYTYQPYPYYPYYPSILSPYYAYGYSYSYPSPNSSDQAIAPLSYIKANTAEFVALQSQNQMLQQQLSQAQGQNQQLQTTVSQQSATISQLNQQLAGLNGTVQSYQVLALGLGILAVILLIFSINRRRGRDSPRQTVESKAST